MKGAFELPGRFVSSVFGLVRDLGEELVLGVQVGTVPRQRPGVQEVTRPLCDPGVAPLEILLGGNVPLLLREGEVVRPRAVPGLGRPGVELLVLKLLGSRG